ncbi:MAG TPA: hypothetical protein VF548_09915 [Allosphingosinicella sp.]|jgi:hypothetical protein
MGPVRYFILLTLLLLGACSIRGAIDAATPKADRAFGEEMVSRLRSGDRAWIENQFTPELWAESGDKLESVPAMFPKEAGKTEMLGFQISTNMTNGRTERSKDFTLVTEGGGRWTVTNFSTYATGGPDRVVQWSVTPYDEPPPELAMLDTMDRALPWVAAVFALLLFGGGALIFWLVRRSRRKHDPWAGGHSSGRP